MLQHLKDACGQVTANDDGENNRNRLSVDWCVDDSIQDIWVRIHDCQAFAPTTAPIANSAVIHLTLGVFERTGVFALAINKWRDKALAGQTLPISNASAAVGPLVAPDVAVNNIKMCHCQHTHGLGKSSDHTSATCSYPSANHETNATITNTMGGNNRIASHQPRLCPNA
jgi:hypothetical protein